jgi:hypothetical protein
MVMSDNTADPAARCALEVIASALGPAKQGKKKPAV